jgi:hypothetical protein
LKKTYLFGDGKEMHIARIEGPAAWYSLYFLGPRVEGTKGGGRAWQEGQMIGEDIPFGDGKGMHVARIESPAAGYALYLPSLGKQEEEDRIN